jgi:hypothetical protein
MSRATIGQQVREGYRVGGATDNSCVPSTGSGQGGRCHCAQSAWLATLLAQVEGRVGGTMDHTQLQWTQNRIVHVPHTLDSQCNHCVNTRGCLTV